MKNKYIFSVILVTTLLFSCQPMLTYNITNKANNAYEYTINTRLKSVDISFFANYSWVGKDTVQTAISIFVENGSRYEIEINRKDMMVVSTTFDYELEMDKPIIIKPKSNRSFWLEYQAIYNPQSLTTIHQMPSDEELILLAKGITINGRQLPVEDIAFNPSAKRIATMH